MKTVKFYFSDGTSVELSSVTEKDDFNTMILRKPRTFLHIFKAYMSAPQEMLLKKFYLTNLVNKTIDKTEVYIDGFLVDTLEKASDHIVSATWEAGQLQKTDEPIQERIVITELYI